MMRQQIIQPMADTTHVVVTMPPTEAEWKANAEAIRAELERTQKELQETKEDLAGCTLNLRALEDAHRRRLLRLELADRNLKAVEDELNEALEVMREVREWDEAPIKHSWTNIINKLRAFLARHPEQPARPSNWDEAAAAMSDDKLHSLGDAIDKERAKRHPAPALAERFRKQGDTEYAGQHQPAPTPEREPWVDNQWAATTPWEENTDQQILQLQNAVDELRRVKP